MINHQKHNTVTEIIVPVDSRSSVFIHLCHGVYLSVIIFEFDLIINVFNTEFYIDYCVEIETEFSLFYVFQSLCIVYLNFLYLTHCHLNT